MLVNRTRREKSLELAIWEDFLPKETRLDEC